VGVFVSSRLGTFLIVEDDPMTAKALAAFVRNEGPRVLLAGSVADARATLSPLIRLSGAVIDVGLPDGSGFEILETLRAAPIFVPTLILTSLFTHENAARAFDLRAEFLSKLSGLDRVLSFVRRTLQGAGLRDRERLAIERFVHEHGLGSRHAVVIQLAFAGHRREDLAQILEISENTLKVYIREILERSRHASLREVVLWLRRAAVRDQMRSGVED
jgi:DNA-binding NarL/FixJ family response regulator